MVPLPCCRERPRGRVRSPRTASQRDECGLTAAARPPTANAHTVDSGSVSFPFSDLIECWASIRRGRPLPPPYDECMSRMPTEARGTREFSSPEVRVRGARDFPFHPDRRLLLPNERRRRRLPRKRIARALGTLLVLVGVGVGVYYGVSLLLEPDAAAPVAAPAAAQSLAPEDQAEPQAAPTSQPRQPHKQRRPRNPRLLSRVPQNRRAQRSSRRRQPQKPPHPQPRPCIPPRCPHRSPSTPSRPPRSVERRWSQTA